jgi:hypothetical protein
MQNKIYLNDLNAIDMMRETFNEWLLSKTCLLPVTAAEFLWHCKNSSAFKKRWAPGLEFEEAPTLNIENSPSRYSCSSCGGEFWPGGTSCTCDLSEPLPWETSNAKDL